MFANTSLEVIYSKDYAGKQLPSGHRHSLKTYFSIRGQVMRLNASGQPEVYLLKENFASLVLERLVTRVDSQSYNSEFIEEVVG